MNKQIIEKYIQFAIDNGYIVKGYSHKKELKNITICGRKNIKFFGETDPGNFYTYFDSIKINLYELITSGEFIEAITKGVWNNAPYVVRKGTRVKCIVTNESQILHDSQSDLLENMTCFQAIAIRDGKLEEFITNLLNLGRNTKN